MYSSSDFEHLFIRYKAEAMPQGESIQDFCLKNKVPYNLFHKWYKDTRHRIVPVQVEGQQVEQEPEKGSFSFHPIHGRCFVIPSGEIHDRYPYDRWNAHTATELKLRGFEEPGGEAGGTMLNITGMTRFYYLQNFHDMRCKYERVLSVIHQQLNREPEEDEVFIVMSKDRRKVRLFAYDCRSFSLYEKRFASGYKFMQVCRQGEETVYSIQWKDVVVLLQNPVINQLNIK